MPNILGQQPFEADARLLKTYLKGTQDVILPLNAGALENATETFVSTINAVIQMSDSGSVYPLIQWTFFLPFGWAGKSLDCHVRWAPSTTGSGNVKFDLAIIRVVEGANFPTSTADDISVVTAAPGVTNRVVLSSMTGGDLTSFSNNDSISLRLARYAPDVLDTYTGAVYVHSVKVKIK